MYTKTDFCLDELCCNHINKTRILYLTMKLRSGRKIGNEVEEDNSNEYCSVITRGLIMFTALVSAQVVTYCLIRCA